MAVSVVVCHENIGAITAVKDFIMDRWPGNRYRRECVLQIIKSWQGIKDKYENMVLGLGNFDGVHLGHQVLITEVVKRAGEQAGIPAIFTFEPHPAAVLTPQNMPPMLLTRQAKQSLISRLGVKLLLEVPFTNEFARITPDEFVDQILYRELGAMAIYVGYNFTFGYRGSGTAGQLKELGSRHGIEVHIIPPVKHEHQPVSSTVIRQHILTGDVIEARKLLGYYPFLEGTVVSGERRGSQLGFPTANLEMPIDVIVPANGVYTVKVQIDGDTYWGVANIGTKPTFHGQNPKRNLEVHLLDFCQDLYGKKIVVLFTRRIREEIRFQSVAELVEQIHRDIDTARALVCRNPS